VLQVLLSFTERRPTASVRELAEASGLPLPTAHRYVALLRELGLLEEDERGTYRLGWRVRVLSHAADAAGGLTQLAEPVMRGLAARTGETVMLLQQSDDSMVCVAQVESTRFVRLSMEPGLRLPLSAGASARVLLAGMGEAERRELLDRLAARLPDFASVRASFEREVDQAAERGWAISKHEVDADIWAGAAAVKRGDRTVASLSVACPLPRAEGEAGRLLIEAVREAAAELGRAASA
jgi:DNA-binding IclR family transcriptional regulator